MLNEKNLKITTLVENTAFQRGFLAEWGLCVLIEAGDKVVTCKTRITLVPGWDDRTARLFAADCAEHVMHLIPEARRAPFAGAIHVARLFADGLATDAARDAARAAAWDAARAAARDAARAAEQQWQTKRLIQYIRGEAAQ